MKKLIIVKLQIEGVHRWLRCPFDEVAHLRNYHRHIFHIECCKEVQHDDRDVEIIMFKQKLQAWFNHRFPKYNETSALFFDDKSCEMIANELAIEFNLQRVEVTEDGENGAIVTSL